MKRMLFVSLLAGLLAHAVAASPLEGTWEGNLHGVKAITLTVRESGGRMGGHAVFYIVRDEGTGLHDGAPSPRIPLENVRWDGAKLRFSVKGSNGSPVVMELKPAGPNTAELTREQSAGMPALTIVLQKQRFL